MRASEECGFFVGFLTKRDTAMNERQEADPRKQILFISAMLGFMVGVGAYLAYKTVRSGNVALLAVLPVLFITAIPMLRTLARLKRGEESVDAE